jgi:uncharacterized membrane protein YgaE (UPF0421/DUF939 family)
VSARRLPRRPPLPELRGEVRRRTSRLRAGLWTIAQTAIAVGAAWGIARQIDDSAFFAPISAVISLGAMRGQRTRRAIELVIGVAVGIAVADLIVSALGTSTAVLMLVVALAMSVALLLGGGALLVSQAGVSAIFVATIERPAGLTPDRFVDALIGGAVALLVAQVLLPRDPVAQVRNAAHALCAQLTRALRETAAALADGDRDRARRALDVARSADPQLADLGDAIDLARETVSVRPPVWRARERLPLYAGALAQLDYAVRNTRVLARRAVSALKRVDAAPPAGIAEAVGLLADAVEELVHHLDEPDTETSSRRLALEAARRATAVLEDRRDLQTSALVAQVRSTAVDLLRGSGLSEDEATAALEGALKRAGPGAQRAPSGADSR